MHYTQEITIDLPREKVVDIFNQTENLKHWQTGLQGYKHLSGEPGQEGSQMLLYFKVGKRDVDLTETIMLNELPEKFNGKYEWNGGWNTLNNTFIELGEDKTVWVSECEMHMKGFMKIIAFLMPNSFRKNSYKFMTNFKEFAEGLNQ